MYKDFDSNSSIAEIVNHLTNNGGNYLICWPISDFLHLLKNARTRIATGTLAFDGAAEEVITASNLNQILELGKDLEAHNPLDLLKDDLALRGFTLGNLMKLWANAKLTGVYFLMPFVALNLAIRNNLISIDTRLHLIQVAFSIFFQMIKEYPETGVNQKIYEQSSKAGQRKTLWTQVMCVRACNLCIGLYWAIKTFPDSLALRRIGTASVECLFGTTRSGLRGDTRWERFLGREVDAIIAQGLLKDLELKPFIRRFRSVSGCTLMGADPQAITVSFDNAAEQVYLLASLLKLGGSALAAVDGDSILLNFEKLSEKLIEADYCEIIHRPCLTGGTCIMNRYFAGQVKEEPTTTDEALSIVFAVADDVGTS
jgi:hypothetical protein